MSMGFATFIMPKMFEDEERESEKIAFLISFIGISEGAIPFAASDPVRVLLSIVIGRCCFEYNCCILRCCRSVVDHSPHGGSIVLPVVDNKLGFIIVMFVGVVVAN
ncbi:hypothetical protein [Borrelia miyamotoi]|uniref:hypothetical protein n=1 Tax=Borrelia miyamotoi TaxID=47466 RepID=UPI001C7826E0|nr:hypothetical protein [Borrelia miyamotoi]BCR21011.1 PTS fructose-like transporter subunit EIIC [Borrelia miyamotoi]